MGMEKIKNENMKKQNFDFLSLPRKIVVSGGKGGVGKSTVCIYLASKLLSFGKKVILCDLDVEAPNLHLLVGKKLVHIKKKVYLNFPKLIKERCRKCGRCVRVCRNNAIFQPPDSFPIFFQELCSGCGACMKICRYGAIKPERREIGKIYLNRVEKNLFLISGVAKIGLEETGIVALKTREYALSLAEKKKVDYIIFDSAPGIHCPTIHAFLKADLAILVTEPTPLGAHDLKIVLKLARKLSIKAKVFLNQASLGKKEIIENLVKKEKIKLEKVIPHSKEILKASAEGNLLSFFKKANL